MLKYVILIIIFFLEDLLSYKYIRKLDKKERKKLDSEEIEHVDEMIKKYKELKTLEKKEVKKCSSE